MSFTFMMLISRSTFRALRLQIEIRQGVVLDLDISKHILCPRNMCLCVQPKMTD